MVIISLINLKTKIYSVLSEIEKTYAEKPKTNAQFPYIVYKFPNSNSIDSREDFTLEVDIWDNKSDTTNLETLTSNISDAMNYLTYSDSNITFQCYKLQQLEIPDQDEAIRRRQLRFICKSYL